MAFRLKGQSMTVPEGPIPKKRFFAHGESCRVHIPTAHIGCFSGRAARHVAQGQVSYDATPTPARCAMPILPQRWLGFRQAEGAPRRRISLHGSDTLRRARPSPSKEPRSVWRLGRGGDWAFVVLD